MTTRLSQNFTLEEMIASQAAARLGINNMPPAAMMGSGKTLAVKVLQPLRDHFGVPVHLSSGYRCPRLNKLVGGAPTSQHMLFEAADLTVPGVTNLDVAHFIADKLHFDQLILEHPDSPSGGWVHVSYREGANRHQVMTMKRRGGRLDGLVS